MSEIFNPNQHLKMTTDAENQPIYDYLEENGLPVHKMGPDGKLHRVLAVRRYLPTNAYRQWFYSVYPGGCIDVEDLTPSSVFNPQTGSFAEYPSYKIKVSLYEDREKKHKISSSFGNYQRYKKYNPSEEYTYIESSERSDNFALAQALAIKGAMQNAGFIYDSYADILNGECNEYIKLEEAPAEFAALAAALDLPKADLSFEKVPEPEPVMGEEPEKASDPLLAFLSSKEEVPKKEEPEFPDFIPGELSPESVPFLALEGAEIPDKMKELIGKKLGDIDLKLIKYFAKKDLSRILTKNTIDAIGAIA